MFISEIKSGAPDVFSTPVQQQIYEALADSGVPFRRVDNDPAITVDQCAEISDRLQSPTVKSLLVANRQLTKFYLVVMPGDKPFITRDFTAALGVSRVSFVKPEILLEMLGVEVGAATPLAVIADKERKIRLILDADLKERERMLLPDGTTTCYMDIATSDLLTRYLPAISHIPEWAEM
ncbi:MAG: prolyl-tRNA synthetase associated domain-containing protein [Clostridium sp.]|nr:hypothetical protein [Prevotella sp.]MCM1378139.1 hypothetical protein [Prevotella sp.]MCM1428927.1 prolyl-tRNA synthetase associated domain-containing protein [Clostridium sp.]MCM1475961.1 hypothetical protein [Muribaculaceae bacterium]